MSDRAVRRAAERKARKVAAKQQKEQQSALQATAQPTPAPKVMTASAGAAADPFIQNPSVTDDTAGPSETTAGTEPTPRPISGAQFAANRANAQKSTGPATPQGRAKSSLNAVKTGLTGRTVLLASDDAAAYQAHLDRHFQHHAPAGDQEQTLVQMLADAEWRILRIPGLEASIYAIGRLKLAELHADQTDPAVRQSLIDGEILLAYRRDLTNLALQERRLRNQHKADLEQLKALQNERLEKKNEKAKVQTRMIQAIRAMLSAKEIWGKFHPVEFGFEFSLAEIEYCHDTASFAERVGHQPACFADLLNAYRGNSQKEAQAA